jgi:hypothetical protein
LCQTPEKEMTEEEKAIIELVGPAEKFDFEISTPPGF